MRGGGGNGGEIMSRTSEHNTGSVSRLESSESAKLEPEIIGFSDQSGARSRLQSLQVL